MLPPELQGKDLSKAGSVFTKQTDSFALSIHIFNLLMNNCHPFGCVGLNKSQSSSSNNPVVHNIVKGNCPYVTSGTGSTSPDAPDIMMLPKEIRQLFDRAFSYTSKTAVQASTISRRPSAEEWRKALGTLYGSKMNVCNKAMPNVHVYPTGYCKCPWCAIRHVPVVAPVRGAGTGGSSGAARAGVLPVSGTPNKNMGSSIRREPWPLWLTCILAGVISGPFMAQFLIPICYREFGVNLSENTAYIILAVLGAISGALIAYFGEEAYQKAYNAWPWLLLGVLVPLGTLLEVAAIMIVIFLVILALYIIGIIFAIVCACAICSGG
jgi:hypothetical protein